VTSADVAEPRPGPGDVVVRVERAGICGSDVNRFLYGSHPWPSGFIMGHESAARSSRSAPESAKRTSATRCSSSPRSAAARASHGWNLAAVEHRRRVRAQGRHDRPARRHARAGDARLQGHPDARSGIDPSRTSPRRFPSTGSSDGLEPLARSKADHVKIQVCLHDS